jgi:hypothetical protein
MKMIIQSGAQEGKTTQELVLKQPDWVQFFLSKNKTGRVASELRRHIAVFDARDVVETCSRCDKTATRMSLYARNAMLPYFWCDNCDPYSLGANRGKLTVVTTYAQALRFVDNTCAGKRSDKKTLIRRFAEAKGLPKRVGAAAAQAFLS